MAWVSYEPGAANPELIGNSGPLLTHVAAGDFGYRIATGDSVAVRAVGATGEQVEPGLEMALALGDYVAEQPGVVSGLSNRGEERATVLRAMLAPAGAPEATVTTSNRP